MSEEQKPIEEPKPEIQTNFIEKSFDEYVRVVYNGHDLDQTAHHELKKAWFGCAATLLDFMHRVACLPEEQIPAQLNALQTEMENYANMIMNRALLMKEIKEIITHEEKNVRD